MTAIETQFKRRLTEEVVQVRAEVRDIAVCAHEREDLPVRVRTRPEIPVVSGEVDAGSDLRTHGLDADVATG